MECDCKEPKQCWEPCGELGNSEEHAKLSKQPAPSFNDSAGLKSRLVIGAKIQLGEEYRKGRPGFEPGQVIELVEGEFEYENGLFCDTQYAPAVWNEVGLEFDSIYHLFGNELDEFADCKVL